QDLAGDLFARGECRILWTNPEIAAQVLQEREKRNRFSVSHRVSFVDGDPPRTARLGELIAEPALAYARISHDSDDLRVTRRGPAECRLEAGRLVVASHEAREATRVGDLEAGAQPPDSLELEDAERIAQPLDPGFTQASEREEARDELRRVAA